MARGRGRERELSDDELNQLKSDVRFLLGEGGWNRQALNRALGFAEKSGSVTNLLYDKSGRVSTTRERFDAVRQLREEGIEPGAVLVEAKPQSRPRKGARAKKGKEAAAPTRRRTGRLKAEVAVSAPAMDEAPGKARAKKGRRSAAAAAEAAPANGGAASAESGAAPERSGAGSSPARVEFEVGETTVRGEQQADGRWKLEIQALCSTEQMVSWTHRVMTDQLQ